MSARPVVVVGTTADYIAYLEQACPGRALFITDPPERENSSEAAPVPAREVLCDLSDFPQVLRRLQGHLARWDQRPAGVACFDCESLGLAAVVARELGLPFPSARSVALCRNKLLSKQIWSRAGVACPQSEAVASPAESSRLQRRLRAPVILKPLTGSGSELVFVCRDQAQCEAAFDTLRQNLAAHANRRLYPTGQDSADGLDARRVFIAEQFVVGPEYSCDFLLEQGRVRLIRIARKFAAPEQPAGTIGAYLLPAALPAGLSPEGLQGQLSRAAGALGLTRALGMADFIVSGDTAYLLEITPRPGGDCLPPLIRHSSGLDMLRLTLDFAAGQAPNLPEAGRWQPLVGLRLFARRGGVVRDIDDSRLRRDARVRECQLRRLPGDVIALPPEDYDSRLLGHVIFAPYGRPGIQSQCRALESGLRLALETSP